MRTLDNPSSHCIIGLLMRNKGADERTRTADLVSLRVCLRTFQPMLVRTEIVLFWAVFSNLEASLCPLCSSAYQPGCSAFGGRAPGGEQRLQRAAVALPRSGMLAVQFPSTF
jgi:hypothetical protein